MKKRIVWQRLLLLTPMLLCGQTVSIIQTNPDQSALLAAQPPATFGAGGTQQALTIAVNDRIQYQSMDGFGASFTDSSAWLVWTKLAPAERAALMRDLFTAQGINLSFLRQPMGATDLARSSFTYDDLPAGESDPTLAHFSIDHDKAYILPVLREALSLNPKITVMALPWSPPAWMKAGGSVNGGSFDEQYLPSLAIYFNKFLQAYGENGVPVKRIAVQNEPLNNNTGYPSEFLTAAEEAQFIAHDLGPSVSAWNGASSTPVQILGYEHNWDVQWYGEWLLRHPDAAQYVAGTSFHCYAGDPTTAYSVMRELFPEKGLWFTECSGSVGSNFGGDLGWNAENLTIGSVRNGAKSVSLWNIALDQNNGPTNGQGCHTCRGVVTIDTSTTPPTITRNVEYYVLGQASKYVAPGAYRIDSNTFGSGSIEDVAFKNLDGSIVVVVYNSASAPTTFGIAWDSRNFSYTLPPGAVATFRWDSGRPGNGIGIAPQSSTVVQGGSARFALESSWWNARLQVAGLPNGASYEWARNPKLGEIELAVYTSPSTVPGVYNLTISEAGGRPPQSSTVQLTVGAPATSFSGVAPTLPGVIQAENWDLGGKGIAFNNLDLFSHPDASPYRPGIDVSLETTEDSGGGYDVSSIGAGEWLDYTADVTTSGLYSIQSRLASQYGGTYYHVEADGRNVTGQLYFPNTGGWQNWTTAGSPTFALAQGMHTLRYVFDSNNANGGVGNLNWFALAPAGIGVSQPFGGTPATVPGVIQAENFDTGGKNAAYYVSATTDAGVYRTSDSIGVEVTSDVGGGYDVGNTEPGEWLNYTVNVTSAGEYALHVRVASGVPGGSFHLACDGEKITRSISVPSTGGWETFQTLDVSGVRLPAGRHVLQLVMDNPGVYPAIGNFNWFSFD